MTTIWKVSAEILVEPGDLPSGSTKAFANILTWGDSVGGVQEKISQYLKSFKWELLSIADASTVEEDHDYGDEINSMIERTQGNPQAIILGRFFSYKEN
jgi:hypothetical protein